MRNNVSDFLDFTCHDTPARQALQDHLTEHDSLLKSVRVQYAESAISYSLRHLMSTDSDKSPAVMKQIITEHITKLNAVMPPPSKDGDPAAGESLIHPVLLNAAKKHM